MLEDLAKLNEAGAKYTWEAWALDCADHGDSAVANEAQLQAGRFISQLFLMHSLTILLID